MRKVRTKSLRENDHVHVEGAMVRLEGKPDIVEGPGKQPLFMWPNMPIVGGRMASFPEATRWTIYGYARQLWPVSRRSS
jgi:hypothetical protein